MYNEEITLDSMFNASLIFDIIRGMIYLHDSSIGFHGNLKPTNCLVDSRWVLKLTDFGQQTFDTSNSSYWPDILDVIYREESKSQVCQDLLYRAPELLRSSVGFSDFCTVNLQKADTYSFAILLEVANESEM